MSEKIHWVKRLLDVLGRWPLLQVDEAWLGDFRDSLGIPDGVYPGGTYCLAESRGSVYILPEELIHWLGAEGYITEDELLLLDVELLLEAAG